MQAIRRQCSTSLGKSRLPWRGLSHSATTCSIRSPSRERVACLCGIVAEGESLVMLMVVMVIVAGVVVVPVPVAEIWAHNLSECSAAAFF